MNRPGSTTAGIKSLLTFQTHVFDQYLVHLNRPGINRNRHVVRILQACVIGTGNLVRTGMRVKRAKPLYILNLFKRTTPPACLYVTF